MQRVYTIERQLRTTGLGLSLPSAAKLISHLRCESASLLRVSYPSLQAARLAALSYVGCMWVACGLHVCCHSVACAARKLPERLFWCGFIPTASKCDGTSSRALLSATVANSEADRVRSFMRAVLSTHSRAVARVQRVTHSPWWKNGTCSTASACSTPTMLQRIPLSLASLCRSAAQRQGRTKTVRRGCEGSAGLRAQA